MSDSVKPPVPDDLSETTLKQFAARPVNRTARFVTEFSIVFAGCFLLGLLKYWLSLNQSLLPDPLYPLTGFSLACLLRYSFRAALPALLGAALSPLFLGAPFSYAAANAFSSVGGACVGWLCLTRYQRGDFSLVNARDVFRLLGIAGVPAAATGAILHLSFDLGIAAPISGPTLWLAVFVGILSTITVFTPASFYILRRDFGLPIQPERRWEALGLIVLMAVSIFAFALFSSEITIWSAFLHVLPYLTLIWIALRLGLRPASIASALGLLLALVLFDVFDFSQNALIRGLGLTSMGVFSFLMFLCCGSALLMGAQHDSIAASRIQTRLALAAADFCHWDWHLQTDLKFHSTAWTRRIGLEPDQYLPLERWIETVHPDDNEAFARAISEGSRNRVPGFNVRFRSRDAHTGTWFWSKSVAVILKRDSDQHPLQAVGMVMDIHSDVEAEELRIAAIHNKAELETLRSQLNPHFLFNCLNSVRALVGRDTERAREMITSLSSLLRYLLSPRNDTFETVENEMAIVSKYLGIEQIRFGANLRIEISISPEVRPFRVPSMVILTLVENAIKHGISKREGGGLIKVEIFQEADSLLIRVTNDGQFEPSGDGIGLENTRRRIHLLAGDAAHLQITTPHTGVVAVTLTLPYNDITL